VTKWGKQASRKAAARKIGFLEVPLFQLQKISYAHSASLHSGVLFQLFRSRPLTNLDLHHYLTLIAQQLEYDNLAGR
jgi:hypothetical protein